MTVRTWPDPKKAEFKLITMDEMGELQPPSWLVRPLFETNSLVMLYGPANEGKTFVALSLALSLAAGIDWAGHKVRQASVVHVVGEGNRGIQKRAYAWRLRWYPGDFVFCGECHRRFLKRIFRRTDKSMMKSCFLIQRKARRPVSAATAAITRTDGRRKSSHSGPPGK